MSPLRVLIGLALLAKAGAGDGAVLIDRSAVGTSIAVDYAGSVLGFPTNDIGALANFVYTGASSDGRTYNFSYSLTNDSAVTSRIRSFGFDVLGATTVTALSSTGIYSAPIQNPLSGLLGTDLCFTVASLGGCTTGAGGLTAGQVGTGAFALTFATAMAAVQLSDFTVNFQSVGGVFAGTGVGTEVATAPPSVPVTVPAVPESETWAMMIAGFGLVGWLLRHRRATPASARQDSARRRF